MTDYRTTGDRLGEKRDSPTTSPAEMEREIRMRIVRELHAGSLFDIILNATRDVDGRGDAAITDACEEIVNLVMPREVGHG